MTMTSEVRWVQEEVEVREEVREEEKRVGG